MKRLLATLLLDERGATAIEYGLIVSLIVVAMMASLVQVANTTSAMWGGVAEKALESSSTAAAAGD